MGKGKTLLTIALPKGRVMKQALKIFAKIGIEPPENMEESRKLIFEDKKNGLRFLVVKPTDVPTYVEYGAADIGIAGKDVLSETERDVYEPLDLKIGRSLRLFPQRTTRPSGPVYVLQPSIRT